MTLQDFYAQRASGSYRRPDITIWLDDTMVCPVDSHIVVGKAQMKDLDHRYFIGMSVFVYAESYSDWLLETLEKIKQSAVYILVGLTDFGDDLGWQWEKSIGETPL